MHCYSFIVTGSPHFLTRRQKVQGRSTRELPYPCTSGRRRVPCDQAGRKAECRKLARPCRSPGAPVHHASGLRDTLSALSGSRRAGRRRRFTCSSARIAVCQRLQKAMNAGGIATGDAMEAFFATQCRCRRCRRHRLHLHRIAEWRRRHASRLPPRSIFTLEGQRRSG
jgi:hypothetical protein